MQVHLIHSFVASNSPFRVFRHSLRGGTKRDTKDKSRRHIISPSQQQKFRELWESSLQPPTHLHARFFSSFGSRVAQACGFLPPSPTCLSRLLFDPTLFIFIFIFPRGGIEFLSLIPSLLLVNISPSPVRFFTLLFFSALVVGRRICVFSSCIPAGWVA